MEVEKLRLLFDFGLAILIWMVQRIVYPSFLYYSKTELVHWHHRYSVRIACIVIPLMLGQLIITGWQVYKLPSLYTVASFSAVLFLWGFTFSHFAPLHGKISAKKHTNVTLQNLVMRNWVRTAIWSLLCMYTLIESGL
ncbi:hypothetical protein LCGC14_1253540 [marine sediment metagenome]|uniref:DUF4149 domain-containing protein n=2 Tax=root TaxID=1 RepID=A0A831VVT6_9FLAO|nr:hypothetical protein [Pricia sp.]HEA21709.1 hypothetical protein [Pricia antarctica]